MKTKQRGFLTPKSISIIVVMLAMFAVLMWWVKGTSSNTAERLEREKAAAKVVASENAISSTGPAVASMVEPKTVAANGSNPAAFGMTWGQAADSTLPGDAVQMSCHGQPRDTITQPHSGSCNPYKGDTACNLALPVLCIKQAFSGTNDSAQPSPVASTAPVAGFVIGSIDGANARCERELGTGWRMAEHHDGGGFSLVAKRGSPLDTSVRHWVHINNQPGNCWDSK